MLFAQFVSCNLSVSMRFVITCVLSRTFISSVIYRRTINHNNYRKVPCIYAYLEKEWKVIDQYKNAQTQRNRLCCQAT